MRTAALTLSWQIGYRHRRELALALAGWVLTALLAAVLAGNPSARHFVVALGGTAVLPVTLFYLFAVFAYGLDGARLEARESGFPARQFVLPVRTAALVGWPMLCGTAAAALAWLAWAGLVFRPADVDLPLAWPALLLAACLAWLQAILWAPFGLPLVRLFAAVLVPTALVLLAEAGIVSGWSEPAVAAVLAALLPPAYLAAWAGVAAARRGDVPDWTLRPRERARAAAPAARPPFASAARAQAWYEGRLHGLVFPFLLVCLFLLLTGWVALLARVGLDATAGVLFPFLLRFSPETRVVFVVFHPLLIFPLFVAGVLSGGLGSLGPKVQASSFLLTRPLTSGALVTAKLRMAVRSALAGMVLTLLTALGWLLMTDTGPAVAGWWGQVAEMVGPARTRAVPVLAAVGLVGLTWLQLTGGMVLGLAGRAWVRVVPAVAIVLLVVLALVLQWLGQHPNYQEAVGTGLPWGMGVLVGVKLAAAAWALHAVWRRRLWDVRPVAAVLSVWGVTAACLLVLAAWLVPAGTVSPAVPFLGVVLVLPLAGILAAPLALDWNRHR